MPSNDTTITSTDIYKINQFVDSVKAKYIDIPEDGSVYSSFEQDLFGKGWSMCEDPDSFVKCFIDGKEVEGLTRVKRPDVLRV